MSTALAPGDPGFARSYGEAWSSPDPATLLAFFAGELLYEDVGTGLKAHDHDGLARFVRAMLRFAPDSRIAFDEPTGAPERFALRWVWSGTADGPLLLGGRLHPPTGRMFSVEGVALCRAGADGLLTEHRDLYDMYAVLRELGLLEPAGTGSLSELVRGLYEALAKGDEEAVRTALHPSFVAHFADGMPAGGGVAEGPDAAVTHWWTIGRAFAVAAEPDELVPCADGRLLVRGRYRGRARGDGGAPVDAVFTHLWTANGGRLVELHQVTDTARWGLARG